MTRPSGIRPARVNNDADQGRALLDLVSAGRARRAAEDVALAASRGQRADRGRAAIDAPTGDVDYRAAFSAYLTRSNLSSAQRVALARGEEKRDQSEAITTAGGFLVPQDFRATLLRSTLNYSAMERVSLLIDTPTSSRTLKSPIELDTANTGNVIGENIAPTELDDVLSNFTLGGYIFTSGQIKASWQLDQDAGIPLDDVLPQAMARRIGRRLNQYATVGTGVGQPTGILNAPAAGDTLTPANGTGNVTAVTYATLVQMIAKVDESYRLPNDDGTGPVWMMNQATATTVSSIVDPAGRPIWLYGAPDSPVAAHASMFGFPVVVNPHQPNLGAGVVGAILFGNFQQGFAIRRGPTLLRRLTERFADQMQTGFVCLQYLDSAPTGLANTPVCFLKNSAS